MTCTLLILTGNAADRRPGAISDASLQAAFVRDCRVLASQLRGVRDRVEPAPGLEASLAQALITGPAVVLAADVPHLPLWRLRDAFTRLDDGADLVIGPSEDASWYLLGLRAAHPELLRALPQLGQSPTRLAGLAHQQALEMVVLPAWYRLVGPTDLLRLAVDLHTMPPEVASHTRTLLSGAGLRSRAIGG